MAKQIQSIKSGRNTFLLSALLCILLLRTGFADQQTQKLTQAEFSTELIRAYTENDENLTISLISEHRLFVKPFVNDLIKESIVKELKGKSEGSKLAFHMAAKTATTFENIFFEKSLSYAVNYLKSWSKDQKEKKLFADSLYALGTTIRGNEADRDRAIEYYRKALTQYISIGDERGEAEVLGGLGLIYTFPPADYQTALSYYREALIKRDKVDDRQLIGNTLNSIGSIYYSFIKDYPEALLYFDKAEKVRSEIGDKINLGRTVHTKAATYDNMGDLKQALDNYNRSYELNKSSGDKFRMAEALLKSATILNSSGRYNEALESLMKSLEMYKTLNESSGLSDALNQIGSVYLNLGDYNAALEKFNEAINITKERNDNWGLASVYNNLGIMFQNVGRIEKAMEYYNNALIIYEDLGDKGNALILINNLGTLNCDMKDYAKAEEYHFRGLKISQEINSKDQEASCLLNLGNDQSYLGKLDESMSNYDKGMAIALSLNNPELNWRFLAGLAENYELRGDYKKSIELNDSSLKILEGLRNSLHSEEFKASYMAKEHNAFEDVINMLAILHEKDETKGYDILSFRYAESSKSRALLDLLAESLANVNEGADSSLIKKQEEIINGLTRAKQSLEEESLKNQADTQIVIDLKNNIRRSEEELDRLKSEIRTTNPRYADLHYPVPVSINEAMALCPDKNTAILEYSVGDSSTSLWVITRYDHHLLRLPGRKTLQEQIEPLRFALSDPSGTNDEFITRTGFLLYCQLILPAEAFLTKKSNLVIIPDGILNYLPFEVLLTENKEGSEKKSYSDLPFLIKKYPLSYVQSASVLKSLLKEGPQESRSGKVNKKLIAFGDPVYDTLKAGSLSSAKFNRLEYSGREVEMIATCFKKGSADIYLRNEATEDRVKSKGTLKNYDYVHFATHGYIDEKKPDLSSLVLTQNTSSGEDGFLRASEIFNLDMHAELVVLSACQTGLGKLVRGEGMVGLTRAFLYAGTPAVMVSLWSVSDISTATLMEEFYRNLVKGDLCKTDALRKAQLTMLKNEKFAHPFYWAPFVLYGEWR